MWHLLFKYLTLAYFSYFLGIYNYFPKYEIISQWALLFNYVPILFFIKMFISALEWMDKVNSLYFK
jgi:hypothetical protein